MLTIEMNMFQTLALAAVVFLIGRLLVTKVEVLRKYCIPAPVVGGIIFAVLHTILRGVGVLTFSFDTTLQTVCMVLFFSTVGFTACFRLLKKGGIQVVIFLILAIVMVTLQDVLGSVLATVFGLDPRLGLCTASIPMVGGHGTAGSFGPLLEEMGVQGASAVAIAAATFGLVAGSILGGPLARKRIAQKSLKSTETASGGEIGDATRAAEKTMNAEVGTGEEIKVGIDTKKFTDAAIAIALAMGLGVYLTTILNKTPLTFPVYIGAMLVAVVIRNVFDAAGKELPMEEIDTLGSIGLTLFLSIALMDLKLWQLADLAIPMIVMLIAQVVLMAIFAYFVVFNVMGHDYEAAVMTTAFCGFGMGATPNAMANMQAVTREHGPAPRAFFIVPLVGSLFIDVFNSTIITLFVSFFS